MARSKKTSRTKKVSRGNVFSSITRNLLSALNISPRRVPKTIRRKPVMAPVSEAPLGTRKAKMKVVQSIVKKMNETVKKQKNRELRKQMKNEVDELANALSKL